MKNVRKIVTMIGVMIMNFLFVPLVQGANIESMTGKEFVKMLEATVENTIDTTGIQLSKRITYSDACVLSNRADIVKYGDNESDTMRKRKKYIRQYNRISNLKKIQKRKRDEVLSCYAKGIFTGKNDGWYSQSNTISTKLYLNKKQARTICNRIINKKLRKKITEDGQVIRTSNLPINSKKFPYIVEGLPNSFYDSYFNFEGDVKLFSGHDQIRYPNQVEKDVWFLWDKKIPAKKILGEYRYIWADKVKKNLKIRLNFNYKKHNENWLNDLQSTYFTYGNEYDKYTTLEIQDYIEKAKKNHVMITCHKVVVEPSSLYYSPCGGYTYRCYADFTIYADKKAYTSEAQRNNELIFSRGSRYAWLDNIENGRYALVFDISVSTGALNDDGRHYAVDGDSDTIFNNMRKSRK